MVRRRAWSAAAIIAGFVGGLVGGLAGVRVARADTTTSCPPPPELNTYEMPAIELAARPRLSAAVGMGTTIDDAGFNNGTHAIPSFFATGGFGDGVVGVDFEVFASSAIGFYRSQDPVNRIALLGFAVVRPARPLCPFDGSYPMRVLRTVGLELGTGFEREARTLASGSRGVIHVGARVELPLTPLGGAPSEVRLRLAAGRNLGLYTPRVAATSGVTEVGDTVGELFAALVTVF